VRNSNLLVASAAVLALGVSVGSASANCGHGCGPVCVAPAKVTTTCTPVITPDCRPPVVVSGSWIPEKKVPECKPKVVKVLGEWVCPPAPKEICVESCAPPVCVTLPQPVIIQTVCPVPVAPVCFPVCAPVCTPVCAPVCSPSK
jgi:hypothetical protein